MNSTPGAPPAGSTHLEAELAAQPDDWLEAADLAAAYTDRLPALGERVAVVGCGTSLYMARAYAALREGGGEGETDAWPASAARLSRDYDRVVAISRSGTTTEVLDVLAGYTGRARVTVITTSKDTPILRLGEPILLSRFDERSVVQTRSATSILALLRAHLGEDLTEVAAAARELLAEPDESYTRLLLADQVTFVGMGLGAALAEEAALKLREATQSWAEAYPATEYRHGPISVSTPGRVVWSLGPLVPGFARDVASTGAHLEHHDLDPMAELVRVHRLCVLRAAEQMIDPDRPRNLARSVVLER